VEKCVFQRSKAFLSALIVVMVQGAMIRQCAGNSTGSSSSSNSSSNKCRRINAYILLKLFHAIEMIIYVVAPVQPVIL
jgi:hypothetical protein